LTVFGDRRIAAHSVGLSAYLVLGVGQTARAQASRGTPGVIVHGDTVGMRALCSASVAVNALRGWFDAVSAGDASKIAPNVAKDFQWVAGSVAGMSGSKAAEKRETAGGTSPSLCWLY
jgi:hypothetical protein